MLNRIEPPLRCQTEAQRILWANLDEYRVFDLCIRSVEHARITSSIIFGWHSFRGAIPRGSREMGEDLDRLTSTVSREVRCSSKQTWKTVTYTDNTQLSLE